jgi:uncharacterized protein YecE (DUF72 family)
VGPFYPLKTPSGRMLDYYVQHFAAVELNVTYYRIPPPTTIASIERRTPERFEFTVKANHDMTHERSLDPDLYAAFHTALEPLRAAGKLSGVLAQFPWAFRQSRESQEFLVAMRRLLGDAPLFVEFRHKSWIKDEVFRFLEDEGLDYVSVDEPDLPGLVPPLARATGAIAYVRFHGRNKANWWGGPDREGGRGAAGGPRKPPVRGGDRYDYLYSEAELKEWVEKIRELSQHTQKTFVFFNNCHVGQAATGAKLMRRLLEGEKLL